MIRNDAEYRRTIARITEYHLEIVDRRDHLRQLEYLDPQADEMIHDLKSKCRNLEGEIATYERRASNFVPTA